MATNQLHKPISMPNTPFTSSLLAQIPSLHIPKSLHFSKPTTKFPLSLSFSLQRPHLSSSFVTFVAAQTSDWDQTTPNAVLDEGSEEGSDLGDGSGANWETQEFVAQVDDTQGTGGTEGESGGVPEPSEPSEEAKLYVGNLPYDVDSEKLAQLFEGAGVVEIAEVIYNRETDRSRGFGFVTMSTVEEAEKAVEMFSGYELNSRFLTVNKSAPRGSRPERPPRAYEPSFRAYVGNLPWDVDDARLEQIFSEYGTVRSARVVSDRETGRSRGFGFVTMASESELSDAIAALDGQTLDGRTIRVNVAEDRPRRNF